MNAISVAWAFRVANAKRNLELYLRGYLRPELLAPIKLDSILRPLKDSLGRVLRVAADRPEYEEDLAVEELIDRFMAENKGEDLRARLKGHVQFNYHLSPEEADKLVAPRGPVKDRELLEKAQKELGAGIYSYIRETLHNYAMQWVKKHRGIERMPEEPESEMEEGVYTEDKPAEWVLESEKKVEDDLEREDWKEGLLEGILKVIDEKFTNEKKRTLAKIIVRDMLMAENPRTQKDIEKETGVPDDTISRVKNEVTRVLAPFLASRTGRPLKLEELREEKETRVPKYTEVLKDPGKAKDFQEYLRMHMMTLGAGRPLSDDTKNVLLSFAKGKTVSEVAEETSVLKGTVKVNKHRYFDPAFEAWYKESRMASELPYRIVESKEIWLKEMEKVIRNIPEESWTPILDMATYIDRGSMADIERSKKKVFDILEKAGLDREGLQQFFSKEWAMKGFARMVESERDVREHPPVVEDPEEKGTHANLINKALEPNANLFLVTVHFHSDYDNMEMLKEGFEKKDPHFGYGGTGWNDYVASLSLERSGGKSAKTVDYEYRQKLNDDGSFSGTGVSVLKLDGEETDNGLKKKLDHHVETVLKPEGVIPHKHCGVRYINDVTKERYVGVYRFVNRFRGVGHPDPAHKNREKEFEVRQLKKWAPEQVSTSELEELGAEQTRLKLELKQETGRRNPDKARIEMLEKDITRIKDLIKDKTRDTKEVEDTIRQIELHELGVIQEQYDAKSKELSDARIQKPVDEDLVKTLQKEVATLRETLGDISRRVKKAEEVEPESFPDLRDASEELQKPERVTSPLIVYRKYENYLLTMPGKEPKIIQNVNYNILKEKVEQMGGTLTPIKSEKELEKIQEELGIKVEKGPKVAPKEPVKEPIKVPEVSWRGLPAPGTGVAWLVGKFKDYGMTTRPDPELWLSPDDLVVLAKTFKVATNGKYKADIAGAKEKGKKEEKESKIEEIEKDYKDILQRAMKEFDEFPEDLKARRNRFQKEDAEGYAAYSKKYNMDWVDDSHRVESVLDRVGHILKYEKKEEYADKPSSVLMLELEKFNAIKVFLQEELNSLDAVAQDLANAPMEPADFGELIPRLTKNLDDSEKGRRGIEDVIKDLLKLTESRPEAGTERAISEEEKKFLTEASDHVKSLTKDINSVRYLLTEYKTIPAETAGQFLKGKLGYFAREYSYLSRVLWFRAMHVEKFAAEDADLNGLRNRIVKETEHLASQHITAKDAIRSGASKVKGLLDTFLDKIHGIGKTGASVKLPYAPIMAATLEEKLDPGAVEKLTGRPPQISEEPVKPKPTLEQERMRAIFPEDELHAAEQAIHHLGLTSPQTGEGIKTKGRRSPEKAKALQEAAQTELDLIKRNVTEAYREGFDEDRIRALAKKHNDSMAGIAIKLTRVKDKLARKALSEFIRKCQKLNVGIKERPSRSDTGNKEPKEYEQVGELVFALIPELAQMAPPADEGVEDAELDKYFADPNKAVPSPQEIVKSLERMIGYAKEHMEKEKKREEEEKHPMEREHERKDIEDLFYSGEPEKGSHGHKSKHRQKPIKIPIPRATPEIMRSEAAKLLKSSESPRQVLLNWMAPYLKHVRDIVRGVQEDEYIDPDDIIDALVARIKMLYQEILKLNIAPSAKLKIINKMVGQPSEPAHLRVVAQPDIVVDNYSDLKRLYDRIVGIYDHINHYISPPEHKLGMPPASLADIRGKFEQAKKYLPAGITELAQQFMEKEEEPRELPPGYEPLRKETAEPSEAGRKVQEMKGSQHYPMELKVASAAREIVSDDFYEAVLK